MQGQDIVQRAEPHLRRAAVAVQDRAAFLAERHGPGLIVRGHLEASGALPAQADLYKGGRGCFATDGQGAARLDRNRLYARQPDPGADIAGVARQRGEGGRPALRRHLDLKGGIAGVGYARRQDAASAVAEPRLQGGPQLAGDAVARRVAVADLEDVHRSRPGSRERLEHAVQRLGLAQAVRADGDAGRGRISGSIGRLGGRRGRQNSRDKGPGERLHAQAAGGAAGAAGAAGAGRSSPASRFSRAATGALIRR